MADVAAKKKSKPKEGAKPGKGRGDAKKKSKGGGGSKKVSKLTPATTKPLARLNLDDLEKLRETLYETQVMGEVSPAHMRLPTHSAPPPSLPASWPKRWRCP